MKNIKEISTRLEIAKKNLKKNKAKNNNSNIVIELIVIKRLAFVKERLTPPNFISGPIL